MIKLFISAVCVVILSIFAARIMMRLPSNEENEYGYYTEEDEMEMKMKENKNKKDITNNNSEKDK